jgi:two-component system LytT family sensor kinase
MASDSLAKFSGLLRYQLYECNDPQITLDRELVYLENFIELEKLRQNKLDVSTDLGRSQAAVSIAPFILMTFVENAFKHVSKEANQTNFIRICLKLDGEKLDFSVTNSGKIYRYWPAKCAAPA